MRLQPIDFLLSLAIRDALCTRVGAPLEIRVIGHYKKLILQVNEFSLADIWGIARLVANQPINGELALMSEQNLRTRESIYWAGVKPD